MKSTPKMELQTLTVKIYINCLRFAGIELYSEAAILQDARRLVKRRRALARASARIRRAAIASTWSASWKRSTQSRTPIRSPPARSEFACLFPAQRCGTL